MTRTIGPVTSTIGAVSAVVLIACWALGEFAGFHVPAEIQGFTTLIAIYVAGWLVSPQTALERARVELHNEELANAKHYAGAHDS